MCGIAGELRTRGGPTPADWAQLSALMARRGPDADGAWNDERATLVFRRLRVLDLSPAADQPIEHPDGRHVLVFNGEIYNFRELRAQLEAEGVSLQSTGDTEVLLHALVRWGTEALARLNGMFALALYDRQHGSLLLARDHAGIKPLYVMHHPDGVMFASQFDQVLAHPWAAGRAWDKTAVGQFFRIGYVQAPHALLAGTEMLEAGSWLEIDGDGRTTRGRHFEFPRRPSRAPGATPSIEALDETLQAAVARQRESDVPLGCFLSGGIDSPLVAAYLAAANEGPVHAYTIGTTDPTQDESSEAERYAEALGIEQHLERIESDDILALLDDVVTACSEPNCDFSIFPTMLVSRLARARMTVMLAGDGGDELFWGYPDRFGSVLGMAEEFRQPRWLRDARRAATRYLGIGHAHPNIRFPKLSNWYRAKHSHLDENDLKLALAGLPPYPPADPLFDFRGGTRDETADWMRWNEFQGHLSRVLLKVDRASMHESLEVRVPLLDREVVEFALAYRWQDCLDIDARRGKLPLRQILQTKLPFQSRAKRGFSVPMSAWLRGPLKELLEDHVMARDSLLGVPIRRDGMARLIAAHADGSHDRGWGLWLLLSLALWEDRHGRKLGYARA